MILTATLPRATAAVALLVAFYGLVALLWRLGPVVHARLVSSYASLDAWSRSDPSTTPTPGARRAR